MTWRITVGVVRLCFGVEMMSSHKKRKVDSECRVFNVKWSEEYFVTEHNNSVLCLICNEKIAVLKEYNIRRHYETKHSKHQYAQLKGQHRQEKVTFLKKSLTAQRQVFTKHKNENEAAVRASYKISQELAKSGKPFTDGELIKKCIQMAVEELCPEKHQLFETISLSARTVSRRVQDLSTDVDRQLKDAVNKFEWFSLALDESTDVTDSAQVLMFVRGVNKDFEVTEELLDVLTMESTCTGNDIFNKVIESLNKFDLDLKKLKCVSTDGGKNMSGHKTGLIGNFYNAIEQAGGKRPLVFHCIIHQQALCGKALGFSEIMLTVTKTVNYIRSHALNHRKFKNFLAEVESEYSDLPYHCEVRWLSRGKVLQRFFELREFVDIFMTEQEKPVEELKDHEWLWTLAFMVDITSQLNHLNLKLQGENSTACDLFWQIKAFRKKLIFFESQVEKENLEHFETCKTFKNETTAPFPKVLASNCISSLRREFDKRFSDFDSCEEMFQLFQNPFSVDLDKVPPEMQLEVIELTSNGKMKDQFKENSDAGNLLSFYRYVEIIM